MLDGKTVARIAKMNRKRAQLLQARLRQADVVPVRPLGDPHVLYRVHFVWSAVHERRVNASLGCVLARYAHRRRHGPSNVRGLRDPARIKRLQALLGRRYHADWLRGFVAARPVPEKAGHVYAYARQADLELKKAGRVAHVLLHKVGLTTRTPDQRIAEQAAANKERYVRVVSVRTAYPRFFEHHVHRFLEECRVRKFSARGGLSDGGTEWFLVEQARLVADLVKIRLLMALVWDDPFVA